MERTELAVGSIEVRGSGAVHRFLNFLGAFFLGIGPDAQAKREHENWWDRDEARTGDESVTLTLGHQAELFDESGHAAYSPVAPATLPETEVLEPPVAQPAPEAAMQTVVSVYPKSKARARSVVTTARVSAAPRVSAVPKAATAARGAVARQLVMSQSISSGREESRWFSVPQRVLLPRYQLFEGGDAVREDATGSLHIVSPAMRTQNGRVWFV